MTSSRRPLAVPLIIIVATAAAQERTGASTRTAEHNLKKSLRQAEYWKNHFFNKHAEADANGDGLRSWSEFKSHKAKVVQ